MNLETALYSYVVFFCFCFFNCYLADPRPTLGHSQGDSLTNPMLIAAFYLIRPEGFIYLDSKKQRKRLGQNGVRSIPIHIPISYLKNMLD